MNKQADEPAHFKSFQQNTRITHGDNGNASTKSTKL
jgi:hypothetical protein